MECGEVSLDQHVVEKPEFVVSFFSEYDFALVSFSTPVLDSVHLLIIG